MPQLFGINQARPRDLVRSGLDVERRSQVNDHRTEVKTSDVNGVLDGDLDDLIRTFLLQAANQKLA